MNLYTIEGGLTENGYETEVKVNEIIEYKKGSLLRYKISSAITAEQRPPEVNMFKTGLLNSDKPLIKVQTTDADKIEEYKQEIKKMIIEELTKQKGIIEKQLNLINSK